MRVADLCPCIPQPVIPQAPSCGDKPDDFDE